MKKKGILFIVPTPIGNLQDITFRAIEILKSVKIIYAEDTRNSGKLLKHFEIFAQLKSYHKFNERSRVDEILEILQNGENVAIISDAGTPAISDPAQIIIKEAIRNNLKVETLPGATAFVPALVSSGLNTNQFYFVGFLPEKKSQREQLFGKLKEISTTLIFYEAPHKLQKFINQIYENFGNRKVVFAREISKMYETYCRTTLKEIIANPQMLKLKGEFVIILEGKIEKEISDKVIVEMLQKQLENNETKKTAIKKIVTETGVSKNKIYKIMLKMFD
ncbi:MAG: 16S rRNA (cytidine(1402)-2'-O)-methyltransferase [Candidatus Cloacimonetes bacterium]|nr:16S rRNA (cytidine(1402)-2'-O)-methyltransferase [Candidatus Cloacimonadota bacterium]MBT6994977.1 16S rRNA (cytidine(1402)-2'-O)-methyltransferase [Candidatus Cloacimonadota bacterium]MBT7469809.1 16S rRNA (cytidine(1402)-2'-O)-methyltransferase [Candidatus Cloacimonadota bacterium]